MPTSFGCSQMNKRSVRYHIQEIYEHEHNVPAEKARIWAAFFAMHNPLRDCFPYLAALTYRIDDVASNLEKFATQPGCCFWIAAHDLWCMEKGGV